MTGATGYGNLQWQQSTTSGSGFTGTSTITASGTPVVAGVIIEEGTISLAGRVDVNTGFIELKAGTQLNQASSGGATGTGFTLTAGGGNWPAGVVRSKSAARNGCSRNCELDRSERTSCASTSSW